MYSKVFLFFMIGSVGFAQQITDTITTNEPKENNKKFKFKQLIIPTVLIGYGVIGIESDGLKLFNSEIKEEVNENIDEKITVDDFSQYASSSYPFMVLMLWE